MITGLGNDILEISRITALINKHGAHFLERVFSTQERAYCDSQADPARHYAVRFAAKEAVLKVLGTGWRDGIAWTDIETRNDPAGKPLLFLTGRAKTLAEKMGIDQISVSVTHTTELAIASAIALGK